MSIGVTRRCRQARAGHDAGSPCGQTSRRRLPFASLYRAGQRIRTQCVCSLANEERLYDALCVHDLSAAHVLNLHAEGEKRGDAGLRAGRAFEEVGGIAGGDCGCIEGAARTGQARGGGSEVGEGNGVDEGYEG